VTRPAERVKERRCVGRRLIAAGTGAGLLLVIGVRLRAHDPSAAPITWNREISRIVFERCASCHRDGGPSFSLMTYQDAQPHASAIKDAVLSRRMPPWGAVKGFGHFRNDQGLTQEQIALVTDWVEGGVTRGNNPRALPASPAFEPQPPFRLPKDAFAVTDGSTLDRGVTVDGLYPEHVPDRASMQIVAVRPGGDIEPLVWLYEYRDGYRHPFLFRKPLSLPAGSVIRGIQAGTRIQLIPSARTTR
jgi:mono/diheme cytochrome c family protein